MFGCHDKGLSEKTTKLKSGDISIKSMNRVPYGDTTSLPKD